MKRNICFSIISIILVVIAVSCDTESITPYTSTSPPKVYSFEVTPNDSVEVGDTLSLKCNADDGDENDFEDSLRFDWYSPSGALLDIVDDSTALLTDYMPNAGASVLWKADTTTGSFLVRVTVTDFWHSTIHDDTIYVVASGALTPPPVIEELTTHSDTLEPGDTLRVSCVATSVDTTLILDYLWSSNDGRFITNNSESVTWIAPNAIGTHNIRVTVSDPFHSTTDSTSTIVAPPGTFNHAPFIRSLTATPVEIGLGETTALVCDAADRDGDVLTYQWIALEGEIVTQGSQPWTFVDWIAPQIPGEFTIRVVVSDGVISVDDEVTVLVTQSFESDFSSDEVTDNWDYVGLLANFGDTDGFHSIEWDEQNEAMSAIGRSSYGSHGFQLNTQGFGSGEFEINVMATDNRFGNVGFIPKFIDERNYLMIGLDFNIGFFRIYHCIAGHSSWRADGYITLHPGRFYTISYNQTTDGTAEVSLSGNHLWSGEVPDNFRNPVRLGVVVYGLEDSGVALFDDLKVKSH